jgi:hypothetical protein
MIRRSVALRFAVAATLVALIHGCGSSSPTSPGTTAAVASISLTPTSDTVVSGQTAQLTATPKDASGAAVSGQTVIWSTNPTTIATVNDVGVVTGVAAGTATVTATTGGKSGTATVTVAAGAVVPVSGGTVSTSDGAVTLTFPAGALTSATPVSIRPAVNPPASNSLLGTSYDFGPTGTQFAQPVVAKVSYDPAKLPAGAVLQLIQLYTATGDHWTAVPGSTVDTIAHTVTAPLSHFSIYSPCIYGCAAPSTAAIYMSIDGCPSGVNGCPLDVPIGGVRATLTGTIFTNVATSGSFQLTVGPLPAGVTGTAAMTSAGTWSVFFTTTAAAAPTPGVETYVQAALAQDPSGLANGLNIVLRILAPGFTITPGSPGFTVAQGGNVSTSITLARTFWTPDVTLSATNLPVGTTASFTPATTSGNSSTMQLNVGASTAPGDYTFTIVGSSAGHANVTTTVGLSVTPGSGFTIAGTPAFATVAQGSSGTTGLQATRTNFSNSIAYTFSGLPTGVTAAVTSTTVTDSSKLTFTAITGATPGTYPITVTGTSGTTVRTTTISLVVTTPGTTIVQADFSNCNSNQRPVWVVYQDGNGAFTQANATGSIYPITFNSARGVIAAVIPNVAGSGFTTVVNFGTPAELLTLPWLCNGVAFPTGKTVNVSVTGMLPNDFGDIGMGGAGDGSLTFGGPGIPVDSTFLAGVADGLQDLIAYRYHSTIPGTDIRWAIRRDQNIPTGGAAATIDFTGPESFAAAVGNFSLASGSEQAAMQFSYITAPGCVGVRYGVDVNGVSAPQASNSTFNGVPSAQQRPADLHVISASTPTRFTANYFHTVTQATVGLNLGSGMPTPTVSSLGGPYKRLQALFNLPSDYVFTRFSYGVGGFPSTNLQAATGYFAPGQTALVMPDLSAVTGYNAAWFPTPSNGTVGWTLAGYSAINQNTACVDGGSYRSSGMTGTN